MSDFTNFKIVGMGLYPQTLERYRGVIRMFDELDNAIDKMIDEQNKLIDDAYQ